MTSPKITEDTTLAELADALKKADVRWVDVNVMPDWCFVNVGFSGRIVRQGAATLAQALTAALAEPDKKT